MSKYKMTPEERIQFSPFVSLVHHYAYVAYTKDWMDQRGYLAEDEEEENGFSGELYVCLDEFLDAEYTDDSYMKKILPQPVYRIYHIVKDVE